MASALRALGLPIGPVVTMETSSKGRAQEALEEIRQADKVKGQNRKLNLILMPVSEHVPISQRGVKTWTLRTLAWSWDPLGSQSNE